MRKLFLIALAASFAPGAVSQAFLEGTWKIDWSQTTAKGKPSQHLLKDGKFTCENPCIVGEYSHPDKGADRPWSVQADGADHPVSGIPGVTTVSIQVVNEKQIHETNKLDGKVVWSADIKVLPDGNTRLTSWSEERGNGKPVKLQSFEETRLSPVPAGAHAVSGTWSMSKAPSQMDEGPPDDDLIGTYKVDGDQLISSDPKKVVYRAKVNGPDVAVAPDRPDDPPSTVSVKIIDTNTVEETYKQGTDVVHVSRMTVRKDGKTMDVIDTWNNPIAIVMKMVAFKQ
jgi:hypothetical protein